MTHHTQNQTELSSNLGVNPMQSRGARRHFWPGLMLATVLPLAALGGCAKHSKDHFTVGSTPQTYKERHPIVLSEQEQTLDVPISSQSYDLSAAAASSVGGFVSGYQRSASGTITVMLPAGSANSGAAEIIGRKISNLIMSKGVSAGRVATTTYDASQHGSAAPIRLSYGAVTANVEKCGVWDKDLTSSKDNSNYTNFGCASQSNLAAMVSNPADLIGPRGTAGVDAARRGKVIETYRDGENTASRNSFEPISRTWGSNL